MLPDVVHPCQFGAGLRPVLRQRRLNEDDPLLAAVARVKASGRPATLTLKRGARGHARTASKRDSVASASLHGHAASTASRASLRLSIGSKLGAAAGISSPSSAASPTPSAASPPSRTPPLHPPQSSTSPTSRASPAPQVPSSPTASRLAATRDALTALLSSDDRVAAGCLRVVDAFTLAAAHHLNAGTAIARPTHCMPVLPLHAAVTVAQASAAACVRDILTTGNVFFSQDALAAATTRICADTARWVAMSAPSSTGQSDIWLPVWPFLASVATASVAAVAVARSTVAAAPPAVLTQPLALTALHAISNVLRVAARGYTLSPMVTAIHTRAHTRVPHALKDCVLGSTPAHVARAVNACVRICENGLLRGMGVTPALAHVASAYATTARTAGLSFHRVMCALADIGFVRHMGMPLDVYAVAFGLCVNASPLNQAQQAAVVMHACLPADGAVLAHLIAHVCTAHALQAMTALIASLKSLSVIATASRGTPHAATITQALCASTCFTNAWEGALTRASAQVDARPHACAHVFMYLAHAAARAAEHDDSICESIGIALASLCVPSLCAWMSVCATSLARARVDAVINTRSDAHPTAPATSPAPWPSSTLYDAGRACTARYREMRDFDRSSSAGTSLAPDVVSRAQSLLTCVHDTVASILTVALVLPDASRPFPFADVTSAPAAAASTANVDYLKLRDTLLGEIQVQVADPHVSASIGASLAARVDALARPRARTDSTGLSSVQSSDDDTVDGGSDTDATVDAAHAPVLTREVVMGSKTPTSPSPYSHVPRRSASSLSSPFLRSHSGSGDAPSTAAPLTQPQSSVAAARVRLLPLCETHALMRVCDATVSVLGRARKGIALTHAGRRAYTRIRHGRVPTHAAVCELIEAAGLSVRVEADAADTSPTGASAHTHGHTHTHACHALATAVDVELRAHSPSASLAHDHAWDTWSDVLLDFMRETSAEMSVDAPGVDSDPSDAAAQAPAGGRARANAEDIIEPMRAPTPIIPTLAPTASSASLLRPTREAETLLKSLCGWVCPNCVQARVERLCGQIRDARQRIEEAVAHTYVWDIPVKHACVLSHLHGDRSEDALECATGTNWLSFPLESGDVNPLGITRGRAAVYAYDMATVQAACVAAGVTVPPSPADVLAACDTTSAGPAINVAQTPVDAAARAACAWAEYHIAQLYLLEADAQSELQHWASLQEIDEQADENMHIVHTSPATDAPPPESSSTSTAPAEVIPVPTTSAALRTNVQCVQPCAHLTVESFHEVASALDNLYALAACHMERVCALKQLWPHAAHTFARALMKRSCVVVWRNVHAQASTAVPHNFTLPIPVHAGMLAPSSNALPSAAPPLLDGAEPPTEPSAALESSAHRRVCAYLHSNDAAGNLLHLARTLAQAGVQLELALSAPADTAHAPAVHVFPRLHDPASPDASSPVAPPFAVKPQSGMCETLLETIKAVTLVRVYLCSNVPLIPPFRGVEEDTGPLCVRLVSTGHGTADTTTVWSHRLALPTYTPLALALAQVHSHATDGLDMCGLSAIGVAAAHRLFAVYDGDGDGALTGVEALRMWSDVGAWSYDSSPTHTSACTTATRIHAYFTGAHSVGYAATEEDAFTLIPLHNRHALEAVNAAPVNDSRNVEAEGDVEDPSVLTVKQRGETASSYIRGRVRELLGTAGEAAGLCIFAWPTHGIVTGTVPRRRAFEFKSYVLRDTEEDDPSVTDAAFTHSGACYVAACSASPANLYDVLRTPSDGVASARQPAATRVNAMKHVSTRSRRIATVTHRPGAVYTCSSASALSFPAFAEYIAMLAYTDPLRLLEALYANDILTHTRVEKEKVERSGEADGAGDDAGTVQVHSDSDDDSHSAISVSARGRTQIPVHFDGVHLNVGGDGTALHSHSYASLPSSTPSHSSDSDVSDGFETVTSSENFASSTETGDTPAGRTHTPDDGPRAGMSAHAAMVHRYLGAAGLLPTSQASGAAVIIALPWSLRARSPSRSVSGSVSTHSRSQEDGGRYSHRRSGSGNAPHMTGRKRPHSRARSRSGTGASIDTGDGWVSSRRNSAHSNTSGASVGSARLMSALRSANMQTAYGLLDRAPSAHVHAARPSITRRVMSGSFAPMPSAASALPDDGGEPFEPLLICEPLELDADYAEDDNDIFNAEHDTLPLTTRRASLRLQSGPVTTASSVDVPMLRLGTDGSLEINYTPTELLSLRPGVAAIVNASGVLSMPSPGGVEPSSQGGARIMDAATAVASFVSRFARAKKLSLTQARQVQMAVTVFLQSHARQERIRRMVRPSHRLFDAFMVIGRGGAVLPPDELAESSNGPEDVEFEPVCEDRVPLNDWVGTSLPTGIGQFVFPRGMFLSLTHKPAAIHTWSSGSAEGIPFYFAACVRYEPFDAVELQKLFPSGPTPRWLDVLTSAGRHMAGKQLYTPRALVIMSRHPVYATMRAVLIQVLRLSMHPQAGMPLEQQLAHIFFDVPLPPRGIVSVGFTLGDKHLIVARPPPNALPLLDVPLMPLFQCLSLDNLLTVFGALVCATPVVFVSAHIVLLTPVAEAMRSLLFPLPYCGVFTPITPFSMLEAVEYSGWSICGVCGSVADLDRAGLDLSSHVIVNLDGNTVAYPASAAVPRLPEKLRAPLVKALQEYAYGVAPAAASGGMLSFFATRASVALPAQLYGADINPDLKGKLHAMASGDVAVWEEAGAAPCDATTALFMSPVAAAAVTTACDDACSAADVTEGARRVKMTDVAASLAGGTLQLRSTGDTLCLRTVRAPWDATRARRAARRYTGAVDVPSLTAVTGAARGKVDTPTGATSDAAAAALSMGWSWSVSTSRATDAAVAQPRGSVAEGGAGGTIGASAPAAHAPLPRSFAAHAADAGGSATTAPHDAPQSALPSIGIASGLRPPLFLDMLADVEGEDGLPQSANDPALHTSGNLASMLSRTASAPMPPPPPPSAPPIHTQTSWDETAGATDASAAPSVTSPVTGLSPHFNATEIRAAFVQFLASALKNYRKHLSFEKVGDCPPDVSLSRTHAALMHAKRTWALRRAAGSVGSTQPAAAASDAQLSPGATTTTLDARGASVRFKVPAGSKAADATPSDADGDTPISSAGAASRRLGAQASAPRTSMGAAGAPPMVQTSSIGAPDTVKDALHALDFTPPPMPLPILVVQFDTQGFLSDASSRKRPFLEALVNSQGFQCFLQLQVPSLYRDEHGRGMHRGAGPRSPAGWDPAVHDPGFAGRQPPTVRMFDALINARENKRRYFGALDTSYLRDDSHIIRRHIVIPPPASLSLQRILPGMDVAQIASAAMASHGLVSPIVTARDAPPVSSSGHTRSGTHIRTLSRAASVRMRGDTMSADVLAASLAKISNETTAVVGSSPSTSRPMPVSAAQPTRGQVGEASPPAAAKARHHRHHRRRHERHSASVARLAERERERVSSDMSASSLAFMAASSSPAPTGSSPLAAARRLGSSASPGMPEQPAPSFRRTLSRQLGLTNVHTGTGGTAAGATSPRVSSGLARSPSMRAFASTVTTVTSPSAAVTMLTVGRDGSPASPLPLLAATLAPVFPRLRAERYSDVYAYGAANAPRDRSGSVHMVSRVSF